ncbi:5-formyltetrahydrofolate cyclo-ligase [Sphingobacterium bovistauri]|uniref:5-formyltetrahydrofolate cyclo-ligase n=1 Tax=Sphingobacterium bovistauri TaxID=2781959 RepID=A0ABS7Z922_9SPHI|nr:5-formyltetrahydrofolate cyclo-ligase [Sphingobacterium bovistauri]MCA5006042.1 5-formyltetrahydrofolate cyclo-ligase [Sphingobacterium bovistauri]
MTKDQLRSEYKKKRNNLSIEVRLYLNLQILENLKQFDWQLYTYVHVYFPIEKFNEPDTSSFIKWITVNFPHIKLVVSKSDFSKGVMMNYLLEKDTKLVENNWGILEPVGGRIVEETQIDVVLVPLLVVDKQGNRVGYGKGFYDKFLGNCRTDVKSYGISFFEPIDCISDVGEWDRRLTNCITPLKIYSFK